MLISALSRLAIGLIIGGAVLLLIIIITKIRTFPSSLVAGKFPARKFFELDSAEERQNVKVSF